MRSINCHTECQSQQRKSGQLVTIFSLTVAFMFSAISTTIAMESCYGIDINPKQKFVISRLMAARLQDVEQELAMKYANQAASVLVSDLSRDLREPNFVVINCRNRSPNPDFSEYDADKVHEMHSRHVLFEVWGDLATRVRNNQNAAEGTVLYFMVPEPESPWPVPTHFSWDYRNQNVRMEELFNRIFTRGHHFEILAAVAYGIEESRNHEYLKAQAALCKAKALIQHNSHSIVWSDLHLDAQKLTDAIEDLAKQNLTNDQPVGAHRTAAVTAALKNLPGFVTPEGNICIKTR